MPVIECPIEDCDYKTPALEASIVTMLIDAHCRNHERSSQATNEQSQSPAMLNENRITIQSGKPTLQDIRRKRNVKGLVIGLITCALALLLDLGFSFSLRYWFEREDQIFSVTTKTTVGLWRGCVVTEDAEGQTDTKCWDHDDKDFPFNYMFVGAAQVFQCLGVIFLICANIAIIVNLTICKEKDILRYFAGIHAIWAAVCLAGSSGVVYPGLKRISSPEIDFTNGIRLSCSMALFSALIAVVGGACLLLSNCLTTAMKRYGPDPNYIRMETEEILA